MSQRAPGLHERAEALDLLSASLRSVPPGSVVLIEGAPGVGKTALLDGAREVAADGLVLSACGYEGETGFPFGVVRQLFDGIRHEPSGNDGATRLATAVLDGRGEPVDDVAAVFHGLYWLTAGLTEDRTVSMLIDDAQWADDASLAFVAYLARRMTDLPVNIVLTTRPVTLTSHGVLPELAVAPVVTRISLAPLSERAVAAVLAERIGQSGAPLDEQFVAACHAATGGNPFLLHALVDEIRDQGLPPTASTAAQVGSLAPTGASRAIAARLVRLEPQQRQLIEAVAVLGDGARLEDAAAVTGMDHTEAAGLAVALRDAGLLTIDGDTLACAHSMVRTSVLANIDDLITVSLHRTAADVLARHGRTPSEVAVHLMELRTLRDDDITTLLQAADRARLLGAPEVAATLLGQVASNCDGDARAMALLQLGRAEAIAGLPDADQHLRDAMEAIPEGPDRWLAMTYMARAAKFRGAAIDAVRLLEAALAPAESASHPLASDIEQELIGLAYSSVAARHAVIHRLHRAAPILDPAPPTAIEAFQSAASSFEAALLGEAAAEPVALALRAARQHPLPTSPTSAGGFGVLMAANTLTWCDRFDDAERLFTPMVDASRSAGAPTALSSVLALRSLERWRCGRLADGEADSAEAVDLATSQVAPPPLLAAAIAAGVLISLERAEDGFSEAGRLLTVAIDPDSTPYGLLLHARGRWLVACGRLAEGVDELLAAGAFEEAWGAHNPAVLAWRSDAARALSLLGRVDHAAELAGEELRLARAFGSPRAIGVALAGLAATASGEARVRLLAEAVDVLAPSGARLEHARALIELGDAQRLIRGNEAALEPLRLGLDRATSIGAFRLARSATAALRACGARPRRPSVTGVDALTPSERRVVELAAVGATNRGIAQQLFVSEKTVETHLSHAYDKLGVRDRGRLGELLRT